MNSERLRALLLEPHQSYLRNPLIAKVFYLAGYIEQYGSGTVRMVEWMKEADLPEPEYKEELGGLSVYFYKDIYPEENLRKMGLMDAILQDKQKSKISSSDKTKAFIGKARRCKENKYKSVGQF
jgi:ATP-dependent DNA helicase RecG